MSFPPHSDLLFVRKDRSNEITIHVPPHTSEVGRHRRLLKLIEPTHGGYQLTKFKPNPFIGLACTTGYNFFCKGLHDRT